MLPLILPLALARVCCSLSAPLAPLTAPVHTRRVLMPLFIAAAQQLQSCYLQDMRRVLRSGQMSVWQRRKEERYLRPYPGRDAGRLGTAPLSHKPVLSATLDLWAAAIGHPGPPCSPLCAPRTAAGAVSAANSAGRQRLVSWPRWATTGLGEESRDSREENRKNRWMAG